MFLKEALILIIMTVWSTLCGSDIAWSAPVTLSASDSVNSSEPSVVMDSNGNAMAVWMENSYIMASYLPNGGAWSAATAISGVNGADPCLVVDANGVFTALWIQGGRAAVAAYANAWNKIPTFLSTAGATSPTLAIDGDGNILAAWLNGSNIETATKLAGQAWPATPQQIAAAGAVAPRAAVGGTSAGQTSTSLICWHVPGVATFDLVYAAAATTGMSWGAPTVISDKANNGGYAAPGVDQNGNSIVLWYAYDVDATRTIFMDLAVTSASLLFNGTWSLPKTVSSDGMRNPQDLSIQLEFDLFGNAMAVWTASIYGSGFDVKSSILAPNGQWLEPTTIIPNRCDISFSLALDTFGNAYVSWVAFDPVSSSHMIQTAGLYVNAHYPERWTPYETISLGAFNGFPAIALSYLPANANSLNVPATSAAAVWISYDGSANVIQAATGLGPVVQPPTSLAVTQTSNDYRVFEEYTNTLTWQDSSSPGVTLYLIYRNGAVINGVNPGIMTYADLNQPEMGPVTYGIAVLDLQGMQSTIATVTFP